MIECQILKSALLEVGIDVDKFIGDPITWFDPALFNEQYKPQHDKHLAKALSIGSEVYISGEYYAVSVNKYRGDVKKYFGINVNITSNGLPGDSDDSDEDDIFIKVNDSDEDKDKVGRI